MAANAQVYNSHGRKYEVPRRRVYLLNELQIGDHISFHRMSGSYWHHAIVERIHVETDELDVIEYSNTAKEFLNGNCCPPRKLNDIELAKVVRGRYNFQSEVVYLMLHEHCFDRATVVERATSRLGEKKYSPFINNCEHFAMLCKTGESSSDQVKKTADMMKGQFRKATWGALAAAYLGKTATSQTVTTGVRVVTKKIVAQTVTKMGKEVMKSGVTMTSKQVVGQTVSAVGKEALKTGVRMASKGVVSQSVSSAGQEVVKRGIRTVTKEVLEETVSTAGKEVMKTASSVTTTTTTKEVLTKSTKKSVSSSAALACGALFEGFSTVYDISCAHEDMKKGNITREEFNKATGKRVMTGFGNFGGSSVGAVVGQAAIPIPLFGGLVGSVVGGLVGSFMANVAANATLDPH